MELALLCALSLATTQNPALDPKQYTAQEMYGDFHFGCGPVHACQDKCYKELIEPLSGQITSVAAAWAVYFQTNQGASCKELCGPQQSEVIESEMYHCADKCNHIPVKQRKCRHMYTGEITPPDRLSGYRCTDLHFDVCFDKCWETRNSERATMREHCAIEKKEYEQKIAPEESIEPKPIQLGPIAKRLFKKQQLILAQNSPASSLNKSAKPAHQKQKKEFQQSRHMNHGNRQQHSAPRKLYGQSNHQSYNRAHKGHTHPKQ